MDRITLSYKEIKEDIKSQLNHVAESFVYIGYRLKEVRDNNLYIEGGYSSLYEFAKGEYGLTNTVVSRFIAINDKFSVGGNSMELIADYNNLGSSKLSEMLTLSDEECSLVTEHTTVQSIRDLKKLNSMKEDSKITEEVEQRDLEPLEKVIVEFFRDQNMRQILDFVMSGSSSIEEIINMINPSGSRTYKKGIYMIFFYDSDTGVKYKKMMDNNIYEMTWGQFGDMVEDIFGDSVAMEKSTWEKYYGALIKQEEQKKPQMEKEKPAEVKKQPIATSQQPIKEPLIKPVKEDIQVEGQIEVNDYPELIPVSKYENGKAAVEPEIQVTDEVVTNEVIIVPSQTEVENITADEVEVIESDTDKAYISQDEVKDFIVQEFGFQRGLIREVEMIADLQIVEFAVGKYSYKAERRNRKYQLKTIDITMEGANLYE